MRTTAAHPLCGGAVRLPRAWRGGLPGGAGGEPMADDAAATRPVADGGGGRPRWAGAKDSKKVADFAGKVAPLWKGLKDRTRVTSNQ